MLFDYIFRNAQLPGQPAHVDIGVIDGRFAVVGHDPSMVAREASRDIALGGRIVVPGFVETHLHLDKACISDRCRCRTGTLKDVIAAVTAAKRDFTEADIYARAKTTVEKAIVQGTTRIRTHVEVDPRIGLRGFQAIRQLKRDMAWAIDLELCVFPQEGLLNDPGCDELLVAACEAGAGSIGGVPYIDTDPHGQIARIFALAKHYDLDIDFHLDFDLDASWTHLDEVCRQTDLTGWGGRVAIGHVSKLSAMARPAFQAAATRLAGAGVAVTVLPATDLYLMGREHDHLVPRGVAPAHRLVDLGVNCSISTNNVLNPFTPFGDCSLIRMANLYANAAQIGQTDELYGCLEMITSRPAQLMNLTDYGIVVGYPADLVVLDCKSPSAAVAELAPPLLAMKNGHVSMSRAAPVLHQPLM
jgi:cytosine deaminase